MIIALASCRKSDISAPFLSYQKECDTPANKKSKIEAALSLFLRTKLDRLKPSNCEDMLKYFLKDPKRVLNMNPKWVT